MSTLIKTPTRKGTSYLEIVTISENEVRVQPTESGRSLNTFWPWWLYQTVIDNADLLPNFSVGAAKNAVFVSSEMDTSDLITTVEQIADIVRPIKNPPMRRSGYSESGNFRNGRFATWQTHGYDLTRILEKLHLPGQVKLRVWPSFVYHREPAQYRRRPWSGSYWSKTENWEGVTQVGSVELERISSPFKMGQLCQMVEAHVAVTYASR